MKVEILKIRNDIAAFNGSEKVKKKYLDRVRGHRLADEIVKGVYWENGKGCAVGCTLHSNNHWSYEEELGIPNQLAYLQDEMFESLANDEAKFFPEQFLEAIAVGADLYPALWKFLLFTLNDGTNGLTRVNDDKVSIRKTVEMYQRAIEGEDIPLDEFISLRESMVTPSALSVRAVLDTLDVLDPRAIIRAYTLDQLAGADYDAAYKDAGDWDAAEALEFNDFVHARAAVWRDKLLECLSQA